MPKHTPGPWRRCGGSTPSYIAITSSDGYIVFGMADRLDHKEHGKPILAPSFEAQRANARLIAASPEMFAMLCRVRKTCHMSEDPSLGDDIDELLARAEGTPYAKPEDDEAEEEDQ